MAASQPANFNLQEFTDIGQPLVGGRLYTYTYGTTAQKAAYIDPDGAVPHTYTPDGAGGQYIALNARGELPAPLYLADGSYDLTLKRADGSIVWTRKADGVENSNKSLVAQLAGWAGATLIGFIQTAAGAFGTTLSEWMSRRVDVWDFMSPAMRADALSGNPVVDHAPAWNAAIAALNGSGRVFVARKGGAVYLLKSTVNLGTSNVVDSSVVINIDPNTIIKATLPNATDVLFSMKNVPGHFNNQRIKNLHVQSTNGNGVAVKFNGQCMGGLDDCYIENFSIGLLFSNAGAGVFNEFVRVNRCELHLNGVGVQMDKDGGDQASMHGVAFDNTTVNVGSGQYGFNLVNVAWYNAGLGLRMFAFDGHLGLIRMDCNATTLGVYGAGSLTCEGPPSGPAILTGTGRFSFDGIAIFMSGVTDNLASPNASEPGGFVCSNYFRAQSFGASGYTANELRTKAPLTMGGGNGPFGSLTRLTASNVESIVAVSNAAHASVPGNGFYTGYTGSGYSAASLGNFLSSDGTEIASKAPLATVCSLKHNAQWILRFDGSVKTGSLEGFLLGSGGAAVYSGTGAPEGVVTASVGSTYRRRDGGTTTTFYVKETGSGNTGWIAK